MSSILGSLRVRGLRAAVLGFQLYIPSLKAHKLHGWITRVNCMGDHVKDWTEDDV